MNGSRRAVRSTLGIALAVLAIPASAATDSEGGLARCAAMAAPDLRLACYDALSGRSGTPATAQGPVVTTGSAAPPAAAAPVAAPVASPADSTAGFGLPPAQVHAKPAVPEALSAIVPTPNGVGALEWAVTWFYWQHQQTLDPHSSPKQLKAAQTNGLFTALAYRATILIGGMIGLVYYVAARQELNKNLPDTGQ